MPKKIISFLLCVIITSAMFGVSVSASNSQDVAYERNVIVNDDGSYYVIEISSVRTLTQQRATATTSGTKKTSHYSGTGTLNWEHSISGSFTYTGTSATCTSASSSYTIYASGWSCTSNLSSKSGASAIGNASFKHLISTTNSSVTLTCSANGVLS